MRRDQFSRDSSFGTHLVLATLSMSAIFMFVAGAITFAPAVVRLEFGNDSLDEIAVLTKEILQIHAVVWPVVLACLIAVTFTSLFLFNRMTEPLFRFMRIFEGIRQGDLPGPIKLRDRDYLKRETKALNEMTAELRSRIAAIKSSHQVLSCSIEEVEEVVSQDEPARIADLVATLREQDKSLRESLAHFKDLA